MSKVPEVKNNLRKKKIKSRVNDNNKISKSILNKKKQSNVEVKNFNIFEIENSLSDQETDENLKIFQKKKVKKSGLPSISEVLSMSENHNLENSSLLNNSWTEKPEKSKMQKYVRNTDVFTSKIPNSIKQNTKQVLDIGQSPLQDKNLNKNSDYSISRMFSDDLSDNENFGQKFTYISSSDDSKTDLRPPLINLTMKKNRNFSKVREECNTQGRRGEEIVKISRPEIHYEPSNCRSIAPLCTNFERNKPSTKILKDYKIGEDLSEVKKELKKQKSFSLKLAKNSSSNILPSESKVSFRINSLENNSVPELEEKRIECAVENEESCKICEKAEERSTSDINHMEKCTQDVVCDDTESHSIDIALSQCNLDHSSDAEDILLGSIEMMDKRAEWLIDENNLRNENGTNLISDERFVLGKSTRMSSKDDKHDELSDLTLEPNINSENSIQLSDSFVGMINLGAQLSGQSNSSSEPYVPEFNLYGNSEKSFEEKNLIHQRNSSSSFSIPQAMYIKQQSLFFRQQNNNKDENRFCFKLCNPAAEEVKKFLSEVHLHSNSNHNSSSDYKHNNNEKKKKGKILNIQKKRISFMNLGKELSDCNEQVLTASNSMGNCLKRRYPLDENLELSNIEMSENEDVGQGNWSENRNISIDQSSCSSFNSDSNILHKYETSCPSNKRSFKSVSHRVRSFVEEWLDKNENDEVGCWASEKCIDKEELSSKRRRLDVGRDEKEARINIEPEILLSNYSSEYDRAYMMEHFM